MAKTFAFFGSDQVESFVVTSLEAAGFTRTASFDNTKVIFTYSLNQSLLEDLYFGDQGLIQLAQPGSLLINLSATTPSFSRELNVVATVSDLLAVEAPLVLQNMFAQNALSCKDNVTILLGGEEDAVAQATEYVELLAHQVSVCGGAGSAQLAKAASTIQKSATVVSAIEAQALYQATRRSSGALGEQVLYPTPINSEAAAVLDALESGSFESEYTLTLFMADVAAALEAADDADLILPQAESCLHLLELLMVIGGMDMSVSALSLLYADEQTCAQHGLDWSRAEDAFGPAFTEDDDEDDYLGFGDAEGYEGYTDDEENGYFGFPGYPGYSEN